MSNQDKKGYVIASVSIDNEGVFHLSYVGWHTLLGQNRFGSATHSDRSPGAIAKKLRNTLEKSKPLYLAKVKEVEADADKVKEEDTKDGDTQESQSETSST